MLLESASGNVIGSQEARRRTGFRHARPACHLDENVFTHVNI
jgi:hypothetical protein